MSTAHGLEPTVKGSTLACHTFACGRCHKPRRGYRMVCGARLQVCTTCKAFIDARRAKAAA